MTIEQAIKKAIEGGFPIEKATIKHPFSNREAIIQGMVFLDPQFWQSLGKAMGWNNLCMEYLKPEDEDKMLDPNEWRQYWHDFIDHLAEGKTAETFFESLTP